jgi:hypothetical protein
MGQKNKNQILHGDGPLVAGFLGAVLLSIPIIIRLAYGNGNAWDWVFLVIAAGLAIYWIMLALRGRKRQARKLSALPGEESPSRIP